MNSGSALRKTNQAYDSPEKKYTGIKQMRDYAHLAAAVESSVTGLRSSRAIA